jgi:GrpB-like predicted nucleotidyltransferase (UPF0157 family)
MLLVGGEQIIDGSLHSRLTNEVKHAGGLTRLIGFHSSNAGKDHPHFFGIEVERLEDIPAGMVAWELTDCERIVWEAKDGANAARLREKITWNWLANSNGRFVGEFTVRENEYWISSNSYICPQVADAGNDDIFLVDYDPSWPRQFSEMADWLRHQLGAEVALRVEHYGSTAIPGMPAKPVIDILVEAPSFRAAKRRAVPLLNKEEWEYWWYSEHMVFLKRKKLMGERTHHIHMAPRGHEIWKGLAFRDYLRSHKEDAERYAAVKRELAAVHRQSREEYTQAKTAFVKEIIAKAAS